MVNAARSQALRHADTPLSEQDTALWDTPLIARADHLLASAARQTARTHHPGRFQLMAAIQSVHAERATIGRTNWTVLNTLHAALNQLHLSAGGAIAAAAVTLELHGTQAALALLDRLTGLASFQPYWALRAEALRRAHHPDATAALTRALGLTEDRGLCTWLPARHAAQGA